VGSVAVRGHDHCVEPDFKINNGQWMVCWAIDHGRGWMSNNAIVRWRSFVASGGTVCSEGKERGIFVEDGGFHFNVILEQDEYDDHICNDRRP
jgi:hypothetical protein